MPGTGRSHPHMCTHTLTHSHTHTGIRLPNPTMRHSDRVTMVTGAEVPQTPRSWAKWGGWIYHVIIWLCGPFTMLGKDAVQDQLTAAFFFAPISIWIFLLYLFSLINHSFIHTCSRTKMIHKFNQQKGWFTSLSHLFLSHANYSCKKTVDLQKMPLVFISIKSTLENHNIDNLLPLW